MQNVPLPSTNSPDCLSSSVCNLIHRCPIHLLPIASGARRSPLIYPSNRIQADGRPQRIRYYQVCSNDRGLWCWDATTQAASDDSGSQRRGWRGVLSFFFGVRARQCRVTLSQKSLWGVCAPNSSEYPNSLRIFGHFNHALISKDNHFTVFLYPILILLCRG